MIKANDRVRLINPQGYIQNHKANNKMTTENGYIEMGVRDGTEALLSVRNILCKATVWKDANANVDPQTDITYIHVPRRKRRPMYIMDTVFHIGVKHDTVTTTDHWRKAEYTLAKARRLIQAMRAAQEKLHGKVLTKSRLV